MPGSDENRRKALGAFLRSMRERTSPAEHGLPAGVRRRTPGLRREELAQLSGISATWYTWIEQGRPISVSVDVWSRLAETLRLSRAERRYLFSLAASADPLSEETGATELPDGLDDCVQNIRCPAYILDQAWNLLAFNHALADVFGPWVHDEKANLLRFIFLHQEARSRVVDWENRARRVVAEFRADVAAHATDSDIQALVAELQTASPVFARSWTHQAVVEREGGLREFRHPQKGLLLFRQFTFRLAIRPDCKLVMLLRAEPGENDLQYTVTDSS